MADKKISELDQVLQINNDAVFPMSQNSGGTPTTYKASITQLGAEIGEDQTFSNLQTTDKTLVGAINEVAQGGGGGGSSNANIAPDYDATSTYAVGDWCIYNGTLYQCNTAIAVAEAFDPTHWTAKKVVDAFADIEDELDGKVDTTDFYATNLPIESGSATNTKDYIDSGLSGKSKLVKAFVTYNGTAFTIPNDVDKPTQAQMCVVGRNSSNGSFYLLWYNSSDQTFLLGAVISGSAPTNGQGCPIWYVV